VILNKKHCDMLEVPELRMYIKNKVLNLPTSYTYLSTTLPNYEVKNLLVMHLHSPLDLVAMHESGVLVGSSSPQYTGVQYLRYGEVQTLVIPEELRNSVTVKLHGQAEGSFTLDIERWEGDERIETKQYAAIPTTTTTAVTVPLTTSLPLIPLQIDYDGDGLIDVKVTATESGQVVYEEISYDKESPGVGKPPVKVKQPKQPRVPPVLPLPAQTAKGLAADSRVTAQSEMQTLLKELQRLLILLEQEINK